ncbi:phosphatidylglycerol lysyltransferase domain-containing protein [Bacteroidales bacterium OttesenSCG-928-A14]|nr:phosphatidylglycerol lysyltransferase domain-containing protein [Bacteroidales bacterium OttesenSCG-928-A14]
MFDFKKVSIEDKKILEGSLAKLNCKLLNYNFIVQFIYRNIIHFEYAFYGDFLIVRTTIAGREQYLFPVGDGNEHEALTAIFNYAVTRNGECHFFQFCETNAPVLLEWVEKLAETKKIAYDFYDVRGEFEYIYDANSLRELKGNALKAKRNHVNHFLKTFDWSEEAITSENLAEVVEFSHAWDLKKEIPADSRLQYENIALNELFLHYFDLNVDGLLIRVDGKIVAFSVGCSLCDDTYLVLFEKADWEINGAYPMINREFVRHIAKNYRYVNRAEDGGNEGLRKAKLSYQPEYLQKVFHLDIKTT